MDKIKNQAMMSSSVHQQQQRKMKKKKKGIKVVYISNPMRVEASASQFRSLVQELTGRDSDHSIHLCSLQQQQHSNPLPPPPPPPPPLDHGELMSSATAATHHNPVPAAAAADDDLKEFGGELWSSSYSYQLFDDLFSSQMMRESFAGHYSSVIMPAANSLL